MNIKKQLNKLIDTALRNSGIEVELVRVNDASKAEFGDYQFNGIMPLAKPLKRNPRDIAKQVVENMPEHEMIAKLEIAGPGFINIWLDRDWLAKALQSVSADERLLVGKNEKPIKVVVDYSSPNMAKQMHVGHLRSTIIGDTLSKLFVFLGDEVIRQNHIGDWGTQFGMLIAYLEELGAKAGDSLSDLEQFYKDAKVRFDADADFANKSRAYVVKLQGGDEYCIGLWKQFIDMSLGHCEEVYRRLGILLTRDDVRAESSYNDELQSVLDQLKDKKLLVESDGAQCVFVEGDENPIIIQKSDGGFLYATTDLAAIRHRAQDLEAKRISYVVDARQAGHFKQIFAVARSAGFVGEDVTLEHTSFGMMLDKDGRPFKTRDGGTVKLIDLLDEAVSRAKTMMAHRDTTSTVDIDTAAQIVGIGAVKYAELSVNRESNYIFDWDRMLSFEGNTALYLQYAYARIQSIFRKHGGAVDGKIVLEDELERRLALTLLRFDDVLVGAASESMPHYISGYLYDLTTLFMKFYEQNPILKDGISDEIRDSRLMLANLVADTIKQGLEILGIKVLDRL